ncbi:MAG: hypothetical protein O2818_00765 [Bacteroidetes bacterium]|nr:hypothetical protein [Bacteroidota bacterium]MDA1335394.1 hypothetical protein [Bacteroidota bacterium]
MPRILSLQNQFHSDIIKAILQTHRILWMDVEMRKNDLVPAMIGYVPFGSMIGQVQHVLCDASFERVARMKKLDHQPWLQFVQSVIVPVIQQKGVIAAYSRHELKLIEEALHALDLSHMLDELIYFDCNASDCFQLNFPDEYFQIRRAVARRVRRGLISQFRRMGLKDFLMSDSSAYDYPKYLRDFSPAEALAYIRPQAAERLPRRWTKVAKRKLATLLTYNMHDVLGMRYLTFELMGMPVVSKN